ERTRETASKPQPLEAGAANVRQGQPLQLVVVDPARERFGPLPQQVRRRAAKHEEPDSPRTTIGEHSKGRKDLRPALNLVEDDQPTKIAEGQPRAGESRETRRAPEAETRPRPDL